MYFSTLIDTQLFERPRSTTIFGTTSWNVLPLANFTNYLTEGFYNQYILCVKFDIIRSLRTCSNSKPNL